MRVLTRYLCAEFFRFLALCIIIFIVIYLAVDFIQKIDDFIEAGASNSAIFAFFFYKTPHIIVQMVPVSVLISVIVMFSMMKKNNEIIALKAGGVSASRLSLPLLFASLSLAIGVFLFSELVVPPTSSKAQDIWNKVVKKRDQKMFYGRGHIWYRGNNSIYWIKHFDGKQMQEPAFYFFDDTFRLLKRIQCLRAVWKGDRWRLEEGVVQIADEDGRYGTNTFREMDLSLPESPAVFLRPARRPEEMSYWQLRRFAEEIRLEGYNASRYLVDMNMKLSFPLISFIMVLIGIPIALGLKRGGTPLAVSAGTELCFLYLLNLGLARSLGLSGVLPPVFSAWIANVMFFLLGVYMMMRLKT